MFETIGRDLDEGSNRRRAESLLISLAGLGAAVGFVVGMGVYTAAELVADDPVDDEPMVMIDLADAPPDDTPPALPPAPPKVQGTDVPDDAPEPEPTPDPDHTPQTLEEPVERPMADSQPVAGDPDGHVDGDADGVDGGVPGGDPDGEPGGTGTGTGPRVFHHRDLTARAQPPPRYPPAAQDLDLGEVRCKARVSIDERGRPYEVAVEHCPSVFHAETRRALLRWRWYPPRDEQRRKVRAQTVIGITYVPDGGER